MGYPGFVSTAGSQRAAACDGDVIGWDIGGAHVKACLLRDGQVRDVAQWACPLWQGLGRLDAALQRAALRWPEAVSVRHAVTMTGEMADLFQNREDGVRRIAETLLRHWPAARMRFFAGAAAEGDGAGDAAAVADWCDADGVAARWPRIASANWLATALHVALAVGKPAGTDAGGGEAGAESGDLGPSGGGSGLLVDIGSTTTDIVAFGGGRVLTRARSDAERLASGELVYHGVVRTPLCALAPTIAFQGSARNVMNEFFATSADVYRLTGELNSDHDLYPAADNAAKDVPATQRRLARMIGLDAREAAAADWLGLARAWRTAQLALLRDNLLRVAAQHALPPGAVLVSAGCGDFLAPELAAGWPIAGNTAAAGAADGGADVDAGVDGETAAPRRGHRCIRYAGSAAGAGGGLAARVQLCAPSVAVAMLFERDHRSPRQQGESAARRAETR